MKITLRENLGENRNNIPYFADVYIKSISIDAGHTFNVPIYQREKNGETYYVSSVCGFQAEADGQPEVVVALLNRLIPMLVNASRFPTYMFIARRSHKMYPVYTLNDEVFATARNSPVFKHVELAKVREYLMDYLHMTGELGVPGKSEKLHVRGVRRSNLSLIRPIFYLKKRPQAQDDNEFWAPVFMTDNESGIYTYAASGRRQVDIDNGKEILQLRSQVAQALIADERLKDAYGLRVDRLLPDYWAKIKLTMQPTSKKLAFNDVTFDIFQEGRYLVAVEHRQAEDRYSFYIGEGEADLRERTAEDLVRRKLITDRAAVQIKE